MSNKARVTISDFYCTECGKKGMPLARKIGSQREAGHLKKLYCIYCQKEVNHAEIRPFGDYNYEDFKLEYDLGRFVEGQKVSLSELTHCTSKKCKYNINGKCWNSKNDFDCGHRIKGENK